MRNKETWFKISGGGFIHSNAHLQKAINTVTIRLRDTEIERQSIRRTGVEIKEEKTKCH